MIKISFQNSSNQIECVTTQTKLNFRNRTIFQFRFSLTKFGVPFGVLEERQEF